jgi:hypothetical protein
LDIARSQVDEAFKVSEVLDAKARNLLQASTVLFAASQAAVGVQVAARSGRHIPLPISIAALLLGVIGLAGVAMTALRSMQLQGPQTQQAINVDVVCVEMLPWAERDDPRVPQYVLNRLAEIVKDRRRKNEAKASDFRTVRRWAFVALGSSSTALLLGLVTAYFVR